MTTRIIIIASGEATRWGNHLGVSKHMIPINGKPLLQDTVDKFKAALPEAEIIIASNYLYPISKCIREEVVINSDNYDCDKFINSSHLWNRRGNTIILYGDVFFTHEAVKRILSTHRIGYSFDFFSRFAGSQFTGKPYGENFAIVFGHLMNDTMRQALLDNVEYSRNNSGARSGGWEWYRRLVGIPLDEHRITTNFVEIDDFTEDFDTPADFDTWLKNYTDYHK